MICPLAVIIKVPSIRGQEPDKEKVFIDPGVTVNVTDGDERNPITCRLSKVKVEAYGLSAK